MRFQTYAFLSAEHVTILLVLGAQSIPVTRMSCWSSFATEVYLRWHRKIIYTITTLKEGS